MLCPRTSGVGLTKATHINGYFNSIQCAQGLLLLSLSSNHKGRVCFRVRPTHFLCRKNSFLSSPFIGIWLTWTCMSSKHMSHSLCCVYSKLRIYAENVNKHWIWFDLLCCKWRDYLRWVIYFRRGRGLLWLHLLIDWPPPTLLLWSDPPPAVNRGTGRHGTSLRQHWPCWVILLYSHRGRTGSAHTAWQEGLVSAGR